MSLRDLEASEWKVSKRTGRAYAVPRSTLARVSPYPIKGANSLDVRRMALALTLILACIRPGARRVNPRAYELLNVKTLAWRVGVSERELDRYLAIFRMAGILKAWQPPGESGCHKGSSGHCFALYEMLEEQPPELRSELEAYYGKARAAERAALTQAPHAAARAPATPQVQTIVDGADALAFLRARARPPP